MQKTITSEAPQLFFAHGENAAKFLKAIKENNHAQIKETKTKFCEELLNEAHMKLKFPMLPMSLLVMPGGVSVGAEEPVEHAFAQITDPFSSVPEDEPEYLKVFVEIARKLILEKGMTLESVVEILCTDKNFVQWLVQKAKEIVNYVVNKLSGGKYNPFEDDVLLGSVDLKKCAKSLEVKEEREVTWADQRGYSPANRGGERDF